MGVLIKDMKMPERCGECFLRVGNCKQRIYMERRPKDCPLVEVKEFHSDLIEREEVIKAARRADDNRVSLSDAHIMSDAFEKEIRKIATIIEAERR